MKNEIDLNWQPTVAHIEWMRKLLAGLNDGGYWGIPANNSIWKHDQTDKVLLCVHGERDDMFHKLTVVCHKLGYTTAHALEAFTPAQVRQHMTTVPFTPDMYGSGKSFTHTDPIKSYLWRPLTAADRAAFKISLPKIPKHMRWHGKLTPQCDFCSHDTPIVSYAAKRMSTGEVRECWRWLACEKCHDAITRNDFKAVERRSASAFGTDAGQAQFAVKVALMAFHDHAVQLSCN